MSEPLPANSRTSQYISFSTTTGEGFTARKVSYLELIGLGLTNAEIAARHGVSRETVKEKLKSLFKKLGANRRTNAVIRALHQGVIQLNNIR